MEEHESKIRKAEGLMERLGVKGEIIRHATSGATTRNGRTAPRSRYESHLEVLTFHVLVTK
jgi:hypothetical protein